VSDVISGVGLGSDYMALGLGSDYMAPKLLDGSISLMFVFEARLESESF